METVYTLVIALAVMYACYKVGVHSVTPFVQNYVRRMILRRYGERLLDAYQASLINNQTSMDGILEAFKNLKIMTLVTDMLNDCQNAGIPIEEIVIILNRDYAYPNAFWEPLENGIALRTPKGRVYFSQCLEER